MTSRKHPRFYFSFRSPYSWLASRFIADNCDVDAAGMEFIPFWEPDEVSLELLRARGGEFLYVPMSKAKHLYILEDIRRLAAKAEVSMAWPVDVAPWWELPHLAYIAARRAQKERDFFRAVYRARWEQGKDICSRSVIEQLGDECGLDGKLLSEAPEDSSIRAEGADALLRCYRDNVFGVPFFISGRDRFWGIDRVEEFVQRLRPEASSQCSAENRANLSYLPAPPRTYDFDHAGGCG